jgi:hypothetical protein
MKCEYKDGLKIFYSGSLQITKSEDFKLFVEERSIPATILGALQSASQKNSCTELRRAAWKVAFTKHIT